MSVLFLLFFVLLASGIPIFVVLGLTTAALLYESGSPVILVAQKILDELNSELLIALPFFGMAAAFMQRGGTAKALVDFSSALFGQLRGGLGIVAVSACAVFGAIAGSSVVTAIAMGTLMVPPMLQKGYGRDFTTGLLASSATLAILIPPSLPLLLYAILAEESVPRLFLAGVVPGIGLAVILAVYVAVMAKVKDFPAEPKMTTKEFLDASLRALPALAVPIVVAVGIYGGFVTISESAVLAALVAFLVGAVVYRGFGVRESLSVIFDAVKISASILIIIATALAFGHMITEAGLPAKLLEFAAALNLSGWQFLLVVNLLLLVVGMFLEVTSVILIIVPIILPMLKPLGIDPIHFAIVLTVNMEIALITPPLGLNLFVISNSTKVPIGTVIRGAAPLVVVFLLFLLLLTFVPSITLWLPDLVYGENIVSPR